MALELKSQGKLDKALRLFQHALALAPKHPEVLNNYGEYLEHSHSDIISADMMYFQVRQKKNQKSTHKKTWMRQLLSINYFYIRH